MGDSQQDTKKKASYEQWTKEQSDLLLELMVDAAARGWRDNSGVFSKTTVEERLLPSLNSKLGCNKTYNNYQSRLKWFKNRWLSYSNLLRFSSGFGYDSTTKKFTALDEVWDQYLAAHPKDANLRYGECLDYEDLEIDVGNGVAVGKNSIRLGSETDARTFEDGDNRDVRIEDFTYDAENKVFVGLSQTDPSFGSARPLESPELSEVPNQRRSQAKRSRAQYQANSSSTENIPQNAAMEEIKKLTTTVQGVYNLLENRERERAYTTWDAIKEIPNLDEDIRIKAFDLLDTKSKKDGFLKMTLGERANWIFHKMRG
ncbi:hypothetical protein M5689_006302 [Euphorbia peplus]|nr:hypothetical protein M5689_006302 [Euphorbia peplus]